MAKIHDKIQGIEKRATVPDVLWHFWQGMRSFKLAYFITLILFIIAALDAVIAPIFYKKFLDALSTATDKQAVLPELMGYIYIILFLGIINWVAFRIASLVYNIVEAKVMAKLRQRSFDYLMEHSYTFFANNFTGSLSQRVNRFARAFENFTDTIAWSFIPLFVNIVGVTIVLYFVNPIISLVIVGLVAVFVIFNLLFSRWKVKYDIQLAEADTKTTGRLSDSISNQNNVQLFTNYKYESTAFKKITEDQAKISYFTWNLGSVVDAVQAGTLIVAEFAIFYYGIRFWQDGLITLGTFILIQSYFLTLATRLWDFGRIVRHLYQAFADGKEMVEIMDRPHDIKDIPQAKKLKIESGEVVYQDVGFSFNATREVIQNLDLTIKAGEKVALIGPSGAGKSTLIRLLLRLYETSAGKIMIDGQDIHSVTQDSLRKNLSLVPQDPILFHRSLKENIRYGKRDATDAEIVEAAKLAHCHEFIKDFPQGYDTLVGERGIKLSGGERQRVAIARAILKNAPILILDEATSSLDSQSESYIQEALDILMKGKTVIVIAHRLSTIRKMDRIIVLEHGKVREQGSHDELLNNEKSLYKKLWNLQAGGFIAM